MLSLYLRVTTMYKRIFPRSLPLALVILSAHAAYSQNNLPELVKQVKTCVVAIATYDAAGESLMTGSGFFLRPGQVVINLHVIPCAFRGAIKSLDGTGVACPVA